MTSGALHGFLTVWSDADATFGDGVPHGGRQFDASADLRGMQADLRAADPGPDWTGAAADAYGAVHTEHRRVLGALAELDARLAVQVDESARIVSAGRDDLVALRQWVLDAAAGVPDTVAGQRLTLLIVQDGIDRIVGIVRRANGDLAVVGAELARLGELYRAVGEGLSLPPGD